MFGISTDAGSSRRTSRIIGPILRWFHPGVTDETISRVQLVVRKGAHFTEYAILALLSWRALRGSRRPDAFGRPDAHGRPQAGRVLATGPPSTPPSSPPPASAWPLPWRQREALLAFAIAVVFALTDEWHQTTVPSRQGQFSDVLIDATGAAGGLAVLWWLGRKQRRW